MKTLQNIIDENNGKQVEVAGSTNAKFQCVDLANLYIRDVLGLPIIEWTNAQDFPSKCLPPNYEYVKNTSDNFPLKGNIVIWKSKDGIGHIAVCIEDGNKINFKSFDQNWSIPLHCSIETHTYTGKNNQVIGWLVPKITITDSDSNMSDQEKIMLEFIRLNKITEGQLRQGYGYITDNIDKTVSDLRTKVSDLQTKISNLNGQLTADGKTASEWQKEYDSASAEIQTWKKKSLQASTVGQIVVELFNRVKNLNKK